MEFLKNGEFQFEKASSFLTDLTDHYLSNQPGVSYGGVDVSDYPPCPDCEDDAGVQEETVNKATVGSRLLSTFSAMSRIISEYKHNGDIDGEFTAERLHSFADIAKDLSGQYAEQNDEYKRNFHENVEALCRAILAKES